MLTCSVSVSAVRSKEQFNQSNQAGVSITDAPVLFLAVILKAWAIAITTEKSKEGRHHRAVKRVSILSNSLTHQVKFGLKNGTLTLSTTNADVGGEGKESLECDYNGDTLELGYNAVYVNDILNKFACQFC